MPILRPTVPVRHEPNLILDFSDLMLRDPPKYVPRNFGDLPTSKSPDEPIEVTNQFCSRDPPDSGKTTMAMVLEYDLGLPFVRLSMHDGFEADDLISRWTRVNGNSRWRDGKLIGLVRYGGVALGQELDSAQPEILARIHSRLDTRTISVPEPLGQTIECHERSTLVGTANPPGWTGGSRPLAPGRNDRFAVPLERDCDSGTEARLCADDVHRRAFQALRSGKWIHSPVSTRLLVQPGANAKVCRSAVAVRLLCRA